jgi:hypothetical protein
MRRPTGFFSSVEFAQERTVKVSIKRILSESGLSSIMRRGKQAVRHSPFFISFHLKRRGLRGTFFRCFGSSAGRKTRRGGNQRICFGDFIEE